MPKTTLLLQAFFFWWSMAYLSFAGTPDPADGTPDAYAAERRQMVVTQLQDRDITDTRVLEAMSKVPRHLFVPPQLAQHAYDDNPLPIAAGQTISQPYIVALMTQLANVSADDIVLEIGTGSGYQAAVLSQLVRRVVSIEIIKELADSADKRLKELGIINVDVKHGDGYQGWPPEAPYDAIIVTAAPENIPENLIQQLKTGGRMVVPVGTFYQELTVLTKNQDGTLTRQHVLPVRFVPMVRGNDEKK
jgi:protein-L-isoaspartate(D-aspartate) O-methyltransferase